MISKIRSTLHSSAQRYILLAFLGIFMISSLSLGLLFRESGSTVIRVNKYAVDKSEFAHKTQVIDQHVKSLRQQFGAYADYFLQQFGLLGDPSQIALNELVREKLLLTAADSIGVTAISEDYAANKLNNSTFAMQHLGMLIQPYFYNALGELNRKAISNYLNRQGLTFASFISAIENSLRQYFVLSLMPAALYVSPASIDYAGKQSNTKRTYTIMEVHLDDVIKELKKNQPTQSELKDYFNRQNNATKHYWSKEKRSGTAWKFSLAHYGIKDLTKENFSTRFLGDARRAIAQNNESAVQSLQSFIQKHVGKQIALHDEARQDTDVNKEKAFLIDKLFTIAAPGKKTAGFFEGDGFIIMLDSVQERRAVPFDAVEKEVAADFARDKAGKELGQKIEELLKNNGPEGIAHFTKTTQVRSRTMTISSSEEQAKLVQDAEKNGVPVERMKKMLHTGHALLYDLKNNDGVGIIVLDSIDTSKNAEASQANKDEVAKKLYREDLPIVSAAFIDSLQKNATIITRDISAA